MKKIASMLNDKTILAIDPATHSLAFSVISEENAKIYLKAYGKLDLKNCSNQDKFDRINSFVPLLIKEFKPTVIYIEQPIYIQNFQTSRLLSYVVGYTWGRFSQEKVPVIDIVPMQWKSGIGYKKVSAEEKRVWAETMTTTEVKKKADFERKNRVKFIIENKFDISNLDDNDIVDAIGIGYWAIKNH